MLVSGVPELPTLEDVDHFVVSVIVDVLSNGVVFNVSVDDNCELVSDTTLEDVTVNVEATSCVLGVD